MTKQGAVCHQQLLLVFIEVMGHYAQYQNVLTDHGGGYQHLTDKGVYIGKDLEAGVLLNAVQDS
ncbi:hypothetical protein [Paenibacillus lignilyticus]|uniref:Uncharacterized protein n=1 Tax=Paenibacillus lignilyticus TaxID=1172615 RepID=A0ABS5CB73_9BACL|nr:hypothetical protein [Paenibacillus lignilyticus]MBP3962937.1 hypothetical protein [Paenibacillus lignilyticus]